MPKVMTTKICFFILVLVASLFWEAKAQKTFTTEEDLKKEAQKFFDNEQYAEAYPLYSQLLSVYPKDPNYNYRFGICMLYASDDKEKPISYLEYASKQPDVEKAVFFFLGKAYHLNYRFDDAINAFNRFKKEASAYQQKKLQVDKQIEMCRDGKTLLKNITDLDVLDKKRLSDKEFFRSYDLSTIGGKLLIKPEDFQSSLDKKAKEQSIIYLAKNNNQIYYSSYGTDAKNGKDIYTVKKLANGEWSGPSNLGTNINTGEDEDYPFLHPNGKVLYFCSKGHNSMGGYDIFKSNWDEQTKSWGPAVNMDFAINTPDDDILYVTDSLEKTACFSSRRSSPSGMIDVYKINTERRPVELALINGTMGKDPDGKVLKSKITVKNAGTGELLGTFASDPETGQYNLNTPGGAKLLLTVESEGYPTQSEVVVLPQQQVFKPFRQEITYEGKTEKLMIKNFFDESVDDNNYLLALNFIKEKAKMEVNASEILTKDVTAVSTAPQDSKNDSVSGSTSEIKPSGSISNTELIKIAYDDAADAQKEAKEMKAQADQALAYTNQKNQEAQAKYTDADAAARQGDTDNAAELRKEGDRISRETVASFNLANRLESDASVKQDEADISQDYAKELEAASKSNSVDALKQLEEQKKRIERFSQKPKGTDNAYNSIKLDADNKQKEVDRTKQESESLQKEINGLTEEIKKAKEDINSTGNDQLKEGLKGQEKDLEEERTKKQSELSANDAKIAPLEKEAANLKNEAELVNAVISQIKTGTEIPVNVTSIDKQKLLEQVNGYKMKEVPVIPIAPAIPAAGSKDSTTISNASVSAVPDTSFHASYDRKYNSRLQEANDIMDGYTRETTKADYYKNWSDSINAAIAVKKTELKKTKDEEKKKILEQNIIRLEGESQEKQQLAEKSKTAAKAVISGGAITLSNVPSSNNPANTGISAPKDTLNKIAVVNLNSPDRTISGAPKDTLNKISITAMSKDTVNKTIVNSGSSTPPVTIAQQTSSPPGPTDMVIQSTRKEADDLNAEAASLRSEAYTKADPAEREDGLKKAGDIEVQAMQKQQEFSDLLAKSELEKYTRNNEQIAAYAKALINNSSDDISRADMLKDESGYYFDLTQKYRTAANAATSFSSRQDALDKAGENEKIAFEKQSKAMELYLKFKPDLTNISVQAAPVPAVATQVTPVPATPVPAVSTQVTPVPAAATQVTPVPATPVPAVPTQATPVPASPQVQATPVPASPQVKATPIQAAPVPATATPAQTIPTRVTPGSVQTTKEYKTYAALKSQSDSATEIAQFDYKVAEAYHKQAMTSKQAGSDSMKAEGLVFQRKADSINLAGKNAEDVSKTKLTESELYLHSLDKKISGQIFLAMNGKEPSSAPLVAKKIVKPSDKQAIHKEPVPEGITLSKEEVYSPKHPIPIDPEMPEGLYFKVQIGAFKKPIQQSLFKGMNPLNGETTPSGVIRYTAGLFKEVSPANTAKDKIKGLGYRDAFVVAFYNGKRISYDEGLALLKQGISASEPVLVKKEAHSTNEISKVNPTENRTKKTESFNNNPETTIVKTTDIATVTGLVYTIQVGVYSKPVSAAQLFNIGSLYTETMNNGFKRYTSGAYTDINEAMKAKEEIVSKGIKDAFIIVFKDGKRMTGNDVAATSRTQTSTGKPDKTERIVPQDIIFKVQLGAYRGEVPIAVANKIIAIASGGVNISKDESGMTLYTIGNYKTYAEAVKMKDQLVSEGLSDSFVVAYNKTERLDVEEAKRILNK